MRLLSNLISKNQDECAALGLSEFASYFALALFTLASSCAIGANDQQGVSAKCKSVPCSNTSTGESPADKAQRESESIAAKVKHGDNDKERWARISLYSDSTEPEGLQMAVIQKAGFAIRLDPDRGHLELSLPGKRHVYAVAAARGAKRTSCPKYNIQVTEASSNHAILRRVCNEFEFRPNRFVASVDYFLYDVETATLRSIWHNEVTTKDAPLPVAKPIPTVRIAPNGYQFDWLAQSLNVSAAGPSEVHTSYMRQKTDGVISLVCTDRNAPKGEGLEAGFCEGEHPPRVK